MSRYQYDEDDPRLVAKLEAGKRALARRINDDLMYERQYEAHLRAMRQEPQPAAR